MKIKSLLTCMMISLVTILPLQAQVGKEMKAFRNKDGITVTRRPISTCGRGFKRYERDQRNAS